MRDWGKGERGDRRGQGRKVFVYLGIFKMYLVIIDSFNI